MTAGPGIELPRDTPVKGECSHHDANPPHEPHFDQ